MMNKRPTNASEKTMYYHINSLFLVESVSYGCCFSGPALMIVPVDGNVDVFQFVHRHCLLNHTAALVFTNFSLVLLVLVNFAC
jgi:hypothetical protein